MGNDFLHGGGTDFDQPNHGTKPSGRRSLLSTAVQALCICQNADRGNSACNRRVVAYLLQSTARGAGRPLARTWRNCRIRRQKAGVYKDEHGEILVVSVQCPHLGCQLEWNSDEKSWDCPCHGSRFDYKGNLLDNPAQEDLPHA
ncbi:MAG: Rieske 2Fe-2S domain-containing protein [Anaeromassilibacillus sp.]